MWTLLLACVGGSTDEDSVPQETEPPEVTYPTQTRVLFFDGNGGEPGQSTGVGKSDGIQAWIEQTYGYTSERRDSLGEPENFRAIFLWDSGVSGPQAFRDDQISQLQEAMATGTRLIAVVSPENCSAATLNPLFTALGAQVQLTGENAPGAVIATANPGYQLSDQVEDVYLSNPCALSTNGADPILQISRDVYAASERPAYGGDLVVVGDYRFMDDTGTFDSGDNLAFIGNLVEVGP